ncbi:MAG: hypothetical protein L0K32_00530, partial [Lacticaseibacillus paracasei]|nr:hypothetical protein [Lacticaseibacillus paracasei]
ERTPMPFKTTTEYQHDSASISTACKFIYQAPICILSLNFNKNLPAISPYGKLSQQKTRSPFAAILFFVLRTAYSSVSIKP